MPAFRLWSAPSLTAPPILPDLLAAVGSKGTPSSVTAFVAPGAGVAGSKMVNGLPVDKIPVGDAVIVIWLSAYP